LSKFNCLCCPWNQCTLEPVYFGNSVPWNQCTLEPVYLETSLLWNKCTLEPVYPGTSVPATSVPIYHFCQLLYKKSFWLYFFFNLKVFSAVNFGEMLLHYLWFMRFMHISTWKIGLGKCSLRANILVTISCSLSWVFERWLNLN